MTMQVRGHHYVWFPRALELFHVVALVVFDVCKSYCNDRSLSR